MVLDRWEHVLTGLETDPGSLASELDWVAKRRLIEAYKERDGLDWDDNRLAALDLQYHDVRPSKSLFSRLQMERLVDTADVEEAVTEPPPTTPRIFPRPLPFPVCSGDSGCELGLCRFRRRPRPLAPGSDDGATQGNGQTCRYVVGGMREPGRAR